MIRSVLRRAVGSVLAATLLPARIAVTRLPRRAELQERLAALPTRDLPLEASVTIHWNEHQVPFIEARTDHDLAFVLGLVHAHLRLAHMEMLRRLAQGRISELVGPVAFDVDHALRLLGFGRAAAAIGAMPQETLAWLEAFVSGLNHYLAGSVEKPHEFAVLGLQPEPWTIGDILAVGRLAASDVNWLVWFRLLALRSRPDWPELWRAITEDAGGSLSRRAGQPAPQSGLANLLGTASRSGSNAMAVSKLNSATGGALLAGDPHLGILLPNPWIVAGYHSPSHHAVGLMLPGLPFIALGRNPWIAWGSTNLHAAASDLVDVSKLPPEEVHVRREPVIVRWWRQEEISVRETAFGPVVTDARMLRAGKKQALALRWLGHRSSDEITAMLRVGRARDWQEFRAALEGYAVPGLTMVYADAKGHIGKAMAATLPLLPAGALPDLVTPAAQAEWDSFVTSADLPFRFDPPEGFVVSANERPVDAAVTVGYFFSPGDRARRLGHLLSTKRAVTVGDLSAILSDVYSSSAVALRDALLSALSRHSGRAVPERLRLLIERLAAWDGYYFADSGGALALELLLYNFNRRFFGHARLAAFDATWQSRHFVLRDIGRAAPEQVAAALARAVGPAARALSRLRDWGGAHRLRLLHPLGLVPIIGRRYRFADRPSAGGAETVFKTAHDWVRRRHAVRYGSTARYVFDLADMDRNYFVLLGGQDGRPGSTTFLDQLALWGENGFMQVPLRPETVRSRFAFKTELIPKGGKGQSAARSRPREQPDA